MSSLYHLHDLLCRDGRVLNRNARKMYGFLPGIVTAVHDKKEKRHMRGYAKVYFPGLQDQGDPRLINPWARIVTPSAGGMIDAKKTKKEKRKVPIWKRKPKKIPREREVEKQEPKFKEIEEETPEYHILEPFQETINVHFAVARPKPGEENDTDDVSIFKNPQNKATVQQACTKILGKAKEALEKCEDHGVLKIIIDGHTSTTGSGPFNKGLSLRRVTLIHEFLKLELNKGQYEEVRSRIQFQQFGWGEEFAGRKRDPKNPLGNFIDNDKDSNRAKCKQWANTDKGALECDFCRRSDVTFNYGELKAKIKKITKIKKKVPDGFDIKKEMEKGEDTIFEITKEEEEIEVEVAEPGKPSGSGFYSPPQIGDEVLCAFEQGDMRFPYIVGSVWNGNNKLPQPKTPADDSRKGGWPDDGPLPASGAGDKKGPATPDETPDALVGGKGVNQVYCFKSRTGNIVTLDDKRGVVRIADRTGQSTIQLSSKRIQILQSKGHIYFFAKKLIRFDCKDFEVYALKNIWAHCDKDMKVTAGKNIIREVKGTWSHQADSDSSWKANLGVQIVAEKMAQYVGKGGNGVKMQGLGVDLGSQKAKLEIDAKSGITCSALMKIKCGSGGGDAGIKADGMVNQNALMKIKWKGGKVLLNAGGKPPGAFTLGMLAGAIIKGAKALADKIAPGATAKIGAAVQKVNKVATAVRDKINESGMGPVVGAAANAVKDGKLDAADAENVMKAAANVGAQKLQKKGEEVVKAVAEDLEEKAKDLPPGPLRDAATASARLTGEFAMKVIKDDQIIAAGVNKAVQVGIDDFKSELANGGEKALEGGPDPDERLQQAKERAKADVGDEVKKAKDKRGQNARDLKDAADKSGGKAKQKADEYGKEADRQNKELDKAKEDFDRKLDDGGDKAGKKLNDASEKSREAQKEADRKPKGDEPRREVEQKKDEPRPQPDQKKDRWGNPEPQPGPKQGGGGGEKKKEEEKKPEKKVLYRVSYSKGTAAFKHTVKWRGKALPGNSGEIDAKTLDEAIGGLAIHVDYTWPTSKHHTSYQFGLNDNLYNPRDGSRAPASKKDVNGDDATLQCEDLCGERDPKGAGGYLKRNKTERDYDDFTITLTKIEK